MDFMDLINAWIITPLINMWMEGLVALTSDNFLFVFNIEQSAGLGADIINSVYVVIATFSYSLITAKLLYKLLNVYVFNVDGDESVPPIEYLKSWGKGVIIITCFTFIYSWVCQLATEISTAIMKNIPYVTMQEVSDHLNFSGAPLFVIFVLIFVVFLLIFLFSCYVSGMRLLFLRLAMPFSCVGLIDNDNGIYSIVVKKITQTIATVLGQIFLYQLSIAIVIRTTVAVSSLPLFILAITALYYAIKLPQDLNEIFMVSPTNGSGQKLSALGRGIQTAMNFAMRVK